MDYQEFLYEYGQWKGQEQTEEPPILSNRQAKRIALKLIKTNNDLQQIAMITGISADLIRKIAEGEQVYLSQKQVCKLQSLNKRLYDEVSVRTEAFKQLIEYYVVDGILGIPQIAEITGIAEDRIRRLKGARQRKMKQWEIDNLLEVMEKINRGLWQAARMPITTEIKDLIKLKITENNLKKESERLTTLQLARGMGIAQEVMLAIAYDRTKTIPYEAWEILTQAQS